jgi:hypothetical protein
MSPAAYLRADSGYVDQFCGKAGYPSRPEARRAMGRMGKPDGVASTAGKTCLATFKCKACKMWHVGHRVGKR